MRSTGKANFSTLCPGARLLKGLLQEPVSGARLAPGGGRLPQSPHPNPPTHPPLSVPCLPTSISSNPSNFPTLTCLSWFGGEPMWHVNTEPAMATGALMASSYDCILQPCVRQRDSGLRPEWGTHLYPSDIPLSYLAFALPASNPSVPFLPPNNKQHCLLVELDPTPSAPLCVLQPHQKYHASSMGVSGLAGERAMRLRQPKDRGG